MKDKEASRQVVYRSGTNWFAILGVIFVLFKLAGITVVATWSWWLVLLPFYVGLAFIFGLAVVGLVIGIIGAIGAMCYYFGEWCYYSIKNLFRRK